MAAESSNHEPLSEKDQLIAFGYQPHHIVEFPDGSALLDLDKLRQDWSKRWLERVQINSIVKS